jgi:hypothetical protein
MGRPRDAVLAFGALRVQQIGARIPDSATDRPTSLVHTPQPPFLAVRLPGSAHELGAKHCVPPSGNRARPPRLECEVHSQLAPYRAPTTWERGRTKDRCARSYAIASARVRVPRRPLRSAARRRCPQPQWRGSPAGSTSKNGSNLTSSPTQAPSSWALITSTGSVVHKTADVLPSSLASA